MDEIAARTRRATEIPAHYREFAAWQSMKAYLEDWTEARHRLNKQIAVLTELMDERKRATETGEWP